MNRLQPAHFSALGQLFLSIISYGKKELLKEINLVLKWGMLCESLNDEVLFLVGIK